MRSVSGAASSLESDSSKGGHLINLYRVPFPFFLFLPLSCPLLLLWRSPLYLYFPLAILLRFPYPFFNLPCALSQGLPRNQRSKRRRLRFRRLMLVSPFFAFFFFCFWLSLSLPEGAVGSIQAANFQTVQGVKGSLAPTRGDTSMGKTPGVAALDLVSGLSTFCLVLIFWSLIASLLVTFIALAPPMAASCTFLCLWKACHC